MEMQLLPWIEDDIVIEIIGKMISFQMRALHHITDAYRNAGLGENSQEVQANTDYKYHCQRISELQAEIQRIYNGENRSAVIEKAYNEYAPYVKGKYQAMRDERESL
ncbi:hypothetical protein [Spirosoma validum]|uniref:Uncharacterized protein n=1 Tax=Spirosoma validum TaxID=2771355 RepID=A0A927B2J1_9BACT|nr:hypothetical protein [Spirosoma validum]MBD2754228.1 hypothetical protein [Spirosoma validum]